MRVQSGSTDQVLHFVAVDATDLATRETGLSSFTVYRKRKGGAATAWTTPTITEASSANMPGVYGLLIDEDTTIDSGDDEQQVVLHITHAGMAPVTISYELFRPKYAAGAVIPTLTGDAYARLGAPAGASVSADVAAVKAVLPAALVSGRIDASVGAMAANVMTAAAAASDLTTELQAGLATSAALATLQATANSIDGKTTNLPTDPADQSLIIAATDAVMTRLGAPAGASIAADIAGISGGGGGGGLDAAGVRSAIGLASANLDTQLAAISTKTANLPSDPADHSAVIAATDAIMSRLGAPAGASLAADIAAILTTALTESYGADGATATAAQLLYEIAQHMGEASVSGTTKTLKRRNGSTTAMTFTLDDATTPTAITRAG